jgi:D-lactate dehydrogenase (cytochrome)
MSTIATARLYDDLRAIFGERASEAADVRAAHGIDIVSSYPATPPEIVVFPESTAEVQRIVDCCRQHRAPIIPFGAGSAVEGQVLAVNGGVCIDLSRMSAILAINTDDLDCRVQPGVTRMQLNDALRPHGLFFSVDPGANATIGGMVATRASGTNSVRYGTMRDNVVSLTVVTPDGRAITTARRARKSSAGYDLTRLFTGSEGTLGVITEVTVRLFPLPRAVAAAVCSFIEISGAVDTVIQALQAGIPLARSEALCGLTMRAINRHSGTRYREQPTLFLEFHGTEAGVQAQAQAVQEIARANGGEDLAWEAGEAGRDRLWMARHEAFFAAVQLRPGARSLTSDVCVPISRLSECMIATAADIAAASMPIPMFGHVGDGNFHLVVLVDPENVAEMAEAKALTTRLVDRALAMEGTCTGEHGIGLGKIDALEKELGEAVDLMRAIKQAIDPHCLMNPGKVLRSGG